MSTIDHVEVRECPPARDLTS